MSKLLQNYEELECEIFRMLLQHLRDHLSVLFQFAWLYLWGWCIIEPLVYSEWAAPIVPVPKSDGSVWICRDYKVLVNKVTQFDKYLVRRTEDLLATLNGGERFLKLDLSHAYQ